MEDDRYTRITLRLPKELHALLQTSADETSKSMNAEIVARLEQSFNPEPGKTFDLDQYRHLRDILLKDLIVEIERREATKKKTASE